MTTTTQSPPDTAYVAAVGAGILGLALTVAAAALFGTRTALSVGVGVTIAIANLVTMRAIIRALVRSSEAEEADTNASAAAGTRSSSEPEKEAKPDNEGRHHVAEGKRGGAAWGAFALLKIVVLFGGMWVLLTRGLVEPIPLVIGYGALPLGIAASSLLTSLAPRSRGKSRQSQHGLAKRT